ncbi:MAG: M14 family zinc carboxypeptidase [Thermoplasmatota archaeon]
MRRFIAVASSALLLLFPPGPGWAGEGPRADDLGRYHTYDEMVSELQCLTSAHPGLALLVPIGQTWENRTIWAVKISDNVSSDEFEPNMTVLGGIHARELISVEVPLLLMHNLLGNYSSNQTIRRFVDGLQLWVVPMLNPDGHACVERGNDWRKNRRPVDGGIGVDLNRNFGHLWGLEASHDPSSEEYCGPEPFSENETRAVRELVTDHHPSVTISYHSYGNSILYPWGNSIDFEPVDPLLPSLAWNMSMAMPEGRRYTPMMARDFYAASGDTDDYFYANLSILPFTVELASSYRPADSDVDRICVDNLPPAHLLLNFTVGPGTHQPRRSISLDGPESFIAAPGTLVTVEYRLLNQGEAPEEIELSVSTESSWTAELSPLSESLEPGASATLLLKVGVPASAAAFETAVFSVSASAASGALASATLTGMAERLRSLNASLQGPSEAAPGTGVIVTALVSNLGNGPESLILSAGLSTGWQLQPLPYPLNLSAGESREVAVRFVVPGNARADVPVVLNFTARAEGAPPARASHKLSVLPVRNLTLALEPPTARFPEGEERNVTLRITNSGNVWENGSIVLAGRYGASTIERDMACVAPFSNLSLTITLRAQRGDWSMTIVFRSGAQDRVETLNFTVLANESKSGEALPDPLPVLVGVVVAFVAVMGLIYWDWRREERRDVEETGRRRRS